MCSAGFHKRHERQIAKKRAALREKEHGVPEDHCPHGQQFGDYDYWIELCRELCGRAEACDDLAFEHEEQWEAQQQQQKAATPSGTLRPLVSEENYLIDVAELLDSQPDEECEENGPNLNMQSGLPK